MTNKELENMNVAFEELATHTKKFLRKYGNPYTTIIADQAGIEVLQGTKAKPFEFNDDIEFTDTINFVKKCEKVLNQYVESKVKGGNYDKQRIRKRT